MNAPALPQRYAIASLLGEGGQGRVYRVRDSLRDRDLALKLVSASDAEFLRREFDTLRQIRHENLIQVFDWGTLDSGEAYYTMELVEGDDWGHRMGAPQPAGEVRRILTGVLRGLAHLHCHGEIHGDLKPGNILLGQGGVVKVTDVGMSGSAKGGVVGTPGYVAPECWEGKQADVRSDLYSVGVMTYEALTGKHPFGGRTIREVVAGQMEGWVPSPGAHGVKVPVDLERVVMRALEREASLRQGSADEFMEGFGVEGRIGTILGGRFVDPEGLLPMLARRVHRSRIDDPTLVTLIGGPGSGKTEWLEQLTQALASEGVRCIRPPSGEHATFGEVLALEIRGGMPGAGESPGSLVGLLKAAARRPLAILLDAGSAYSQSLLADAHAFAQNAYADSVETGDVLKAVVFVSDTNEPDAELYSAIVRIPDLDEIGSMALATGLLGAVDMPPGGGRALHQATGGNPAAIQAALFDLIARGELERIEGRWKLAEVGRIGEASIPSLGRLWRSRWQLLSPEHQAILGAVSMLGGIAQADVRKLEERVATVGATAALRAGGWLKLAGHRVRCTSEGLGELIAEMLDESRKRELATILVEMKLTVEGASTVMLRLLAHPSMESLSDALSLITKSIEERDFARALPLLQECVRHESLLANPSDQAELHLKAVEVSIGSGRLDDAQQQLGIPILKRAAESSAAVRAKLNWYGGTLASRAGRTPDARLALEEAISAATEAGDVPTRVRALVALAELAWMHGDDRERAAVIEIAEDALAELPQSSEYQDERGQLVYAIGASLIRIGQFEKATAVLDTEIQTLNSPYWSARVANAQGGAHFYLGQYDRALKFLSLALERLPDGDAPELRARVHANRGACLNAMGSLRKALDDNERALKLSRRSGSGYDTVAAAAGIAIDLYYLGRYDESIERAHETYSLASRLKNVVYQFKGLEIEGFAGLAIGDFARVERALGLADGLPKDHDPIRTIPRIERLRSRLQVARGRMREAKEALQRALELLRDENDLEDLWGVEVELAVLNYLETGDAATIVALSAITARAREARNIVVEVDAVAAIAQVVIASGRSDAELLKSMMVTLGRAEESGFVDQAARISIGLGGALIDAGDVRAGKSRLVQAQRLLHQIASELNPDSRASFLRSPHIASALQEIERRLKPVPR